MHHQHRAQFVGKHLTLPFPWLCVINVDWLGHCGINIAIIMVY